MCRSKVVRSEFLGRDVVSLERDVVSLGRDVVSLGRDVVSLGRDVISSIIFVTNRVPYELILGPGMAVCDRSCVDSTDRVPRTAGRILFLSGR